MTAMVRLASAARDCYSKKLVVCAVHCCAGLIVVFVILLVEWPLLLGLAWYFEQVLPTGSGLRKHPLFFLPSRRRASPQVDILYLV